MSTSYAGNPANYPANVTLIDDGDPPNETTFSTPLEQLADRTANLAARVAVVDTFAFMAAALPAFINDGDVYWELDTDGGWHYTGGTATTRTLGLPLPIVQIGKQLTEVRIRVGCQGGSGTPGDLPVTLPTLKVFKRTFSGAGLGAAVQLGTTTTDASADVAAYKTAHTLTVTLGAPETIVAGTWYYIEIESSNGDSVDNTDAFFVAAVEYDLETP
jgi:hypothetical protein